jgi:hypothetical protein
MNFTNNTFFEVLHRYLSHISFKIMMIFSENSILEQQEIKIDELEQEMKQFDNLGRFFPELIQDLPAKATIAIIELGNINMENNWRAIAAAIWPNYSLLEIRRYFEKGKMESILEKLVSEGATISQLFEILIKVGRKDIIIALQKKFQSGFDISALDQTFLSF